MTNKGISGMLSSMSISPTARIPHWPRRLRLAGLVLLAVYALYLLAGNLFLNTPLGPGAINRKPEKFQMHWQRGFTWYPGDIRLQDVKLRGHVGQIMWEVEAAQAKGRISLPALLRKQVLLPDVVAENVSGNVYKVADAIAPPLARAGGWELLFPSIRSGSLRGGTFAGVQVAGEGRAKVGLRKVLRGGEFELIPSSVQFEQLAVRGHDDPWLANGRIDADFAMLPNTRAQAQGIDKLAFFRADVQLSGVMSEWRARRDRDGQMSLHAIPGNGDMQGHLLLEGFRLKPGSTLSANVPVRFDDAKGKLGADTLALRFHADDNLHLQADLPGGEAQFAVHADLRAQGNDLRVDTPREWLARSSGELSGRWQIGSLGRLLALFVDLPWLRLEGDGLLEADLRLADGAMQEGSQLRIPQVQATADIVGQRVQGSGSAQAHLQPAKDGTLQSVFDIRLDDYRVAARDALDKPFVSGRKLRLHGRSGANLKQAQRELLATLEFNDARVPDLRAYNRFLPEGQVRFEGGSGTLDGVLSLNAAGEAGDGRLRVRGRDASVGLAGVPMRGNVDIDLHLRRADLAALNFNVAGSRVNLSQVRLRQANGQWQDGWWGKLQMPAMRLSMADGRAAMEGTLRAQLRDVGLVLDLLAHRRQFPDWIGKLVDAGQADLGARAQWRQNHLVLDDVQARNDRFDLAGRLRLQGKTPQSVAYARWGVLGAGVEVQGDAHKLHLVGAKRWFEQQPRYLR
ncbi:MAG: hypothetical protein QM769_06080 [Pseudoxanthomonas sp.]